jgi:cell division protein ZapA
MAIVAIKVNGREYNLACDDGQEEHLRHLADEVDGRVRALSARMGGQIGENMGLLLAAVTMADELIEKKQENLNYDEGAVMAALNEIANRMETIAERV